jgi:hypothetical protein
MKRFAQELYEIAANEVAQHNVVRGIMAKAFSRAGGDEKDCRARERGSLAAIYSSNDGRSAQCDATVA